MHTSLDGFVAGLAGEMDWIRADDQIFEYARKLTDEADTALYGRVTWQMMDSYWPTAADQPAATTHDIHHSRWYNGVAKVIVSNTLKGQQLPDTRIIGGAEFKDQILALKNEPGRNILMFGSPATAHSLMQQDLIDEYWLFVNPVLRGAGIPLFADIPSPVALSLVESIPFSTGVIGLHYERSA
jgi:dihydrofolate reductase